MYSRKHFTCSTPTKNCPYMFLHLVKNSIQQLCYVTVSCFYDVRRSFTVWAWPPWPPWLWWPPGRALTAVLLAQLVPATGHSWARSGWWKASSPPAAFPAWEFLKSCRTENKVHLSQSADMFKGKWQYNTLASSCFNSKMLQISVLKINGQWTNLPNMTTRSSGSVSFSSFVSTWRKKRTVGLSSSPNSITCTIKREHAGENMRKRWVPFTQLTKQDHSPSVWRERDTSSAGSGWPAAPGCWTRRWRGWPAPWTCPTGWTGKSSSENLGQDCWT